MKKQFGLFAIMLLVLSTVASVAKSAEPCDVICINNVKVNGASFNQGDVFVERGTTAYVEVFFVGTDQVTGEMEDVTVNAEIKISGDDIEDETDEFDVEGGVVYRKILKLEIPSDLDIEEREKDYELRVTVGNNHHSITEVYQLRVQEQEKNVVIEDVIFDPGLNVDAGESLTTRVRVENLGDERERDIKVKVSVPALGIQTSTYLNDLTTQYNDDNNDDVDDDDLNSAETTERMSLRIPQNTEAGQYDLFVEVSYDRSRESVEERYILTVGGSAGNVMVSAIDSEKTVAPGKGVAYQVSLTNLGSSQTLNFDVEGVSSWGTARVDPSTVTISEDGKADVFVYVTANDDAEMSSHSFNLVVKSGSTTVKKVPLVANVQAGLPAFDGFRQGLEIGFAILLVILVILGIIIAARRIGKDSNNDEPLLEEDQTYY